MASESSSAMLDMTDECEASLGADGSEDNDNVPPLIMEHGYDIAVKVDAPIKQLSRMETYVTYRVRCVCARWPSTASVRRRYNHFKVLHKRLCAAHPLLPVPPLPPLHSAREQLDRYSASFVANRVVGLNVFLTRVAQHPILTHSDDFRLFLTTPDSELEKVLRSESGSLNLWGLGTVFSGGSENKPANGIRVKDPEFTSALEYVQSLQQKLTTLFTLTNKLNKDSASIAKHYNSMGEALGAWARGAGVGAGGGAGGAGGAVGGAAGGARGAAAGAGGARGAAGGAVGTLPLLAAYCAAVADKIRERDLLHASHIAGTSPNDAVHNRLEQASEALRSELVDWNQKTRSDVKKILLELADRQVSIHQHTLIGWENALKLAKERPDSPEAVFKTVSRHCVQNLSPSKCKADDTPTETERDIDDFDIDSENSEENVVGCVLEEDLDGDRRKSLLEEQNELDEQTSLGSEKLSKTSAGSEKLSNASAGSDKMSNASAGSEILSKTSVDVKNSDSGSMGKDSRMEMQPKSVISDPLRDFAEVDLSSNDQM